MCFVFRERTPAIVSLTCLAALMPGALLLTGCGSGGRTIHPTSEETIAGSYYGNTYLAKNLIAGDLGGNLSMTVSKDGTARGTLSLSPLETARAQTRARTRQTEDDSAGDEPTSGDDGNTVFTTAYEPYNVTLSGTFDAATGKFALGGTYIVGGDAAVPVTVTGALPPPPQAAGGALTIDIGGTTYPTAAFTGAYKGSAGL